MYILQQVEGFEFFLTWIRNYIKQLNAVNDPCCTLEIDMLSRPPSRFAYSHPGYIVNGFRFRTKEVDDTKVTQLSEVIIKTDLISEIDGYYGRMIDIVELLFDHQNCIILFQCDW